MKHGFVKTQNATQFLKGVSDLSQRGASECCFLVVDGEPGTSKTATTQWWAVQTGAVFVRAKKEWTPSWMMRDLLHELRCVPEYSFEKMYKQAMLALNDRAMLADHDGLTFAIVIDEADHISRSEKLLETLRDLSDGLEIPFILVGMGRVRQNLTRFRQISSRVAKPVEFLPATLADATEMVQKLCDVPVHTDLIALLHKVSGGLFREMKEGIAAIERVGRRNAGKVIGIDEMQGQQLLVDRKTGQAIMVRG